MAGELTSPRSNTSDQSSRPRSSVHDDEVSRNYRDLSPYDFEILARDLLQEEMGARLETFPQGPDGGVDIRLFRNETEELIVQCKHTPGKRYPEIRAQLQREAEKVEGRFSGRYMLITSASLTRANKREIAGLFKGVSISENDVWGVEDLENYLGLHPHVEQRNFKLWITSTAVMTRLLHNDVYERSAGLFEDIKLKAQVYVQNEAYSVALKMLQDNSVCLISGEPGIGKSTLAEMLMVNSLTEGWTIFSISEDVAEIDAVWSSAEKQLFYYDDFLGQNSLADKLNKNEDSRIAHAINRIQRSPDKRLVMTTREYILRHAAQVYEPLRRNRFLTDGKIILNLTHYTPHQKAHILYNHLYFSTLSRSARQSILADRFYRQIVAHPNYNPRLVELVTTTYTDEASASFAEYLGRALEDPSHLWDVIFEDQLSDVERNILLVLATFTHPVSIQCLELAVRNYERQSSQPVSTPRQFMQALKRLHGTFLSFDGVRLQQTNGKNVSLVRLANPSFNDYVCQYLISRVREIGYLIDGASFFEQLTTLWNWHNGTYAQVEDVLASLMRAFSGFLPRKRKPATYMLYGLAAEFARALFRTVDGRPAEWVWDRGEGLRIRQADYARRYIQVLRMDEQSGYQILPSDMVDSLYLNALERLKGERGDSFDIGKYVTILSLIVDSSKCTRDLTELRDLAYGIARRRGEEPADYENRWLLLGLQRISKIPDVEVEKDKLIEEFLEFVPLWDEMQVRNAESASECEESLGELLNVVDVLGVEEHLPNLDLYDALESWKEKEAEEESSVEYGDYLDDDEDAVSAQTFSPRSTTDHTSRSSGSDMDDLFSSLAE